MGNIENSEWNEYYNHQGKYAVAGSDASLRLIAFIFNLISTILFGFLLIPLCWAIPMTVHSWKVYKGVKPNTTCFAIFDLIFLNVIAGILLLCSTKDNIIQI